MIYTIQPYIFTTTSGKNIYTMGPQNDVPGVINNFSIPSLVGGTSYVDGFYTNVPLTGGTGTGAVANVTVNLGAVIDVQVVVGGKNYKVTDVLSCSNTHLGGAGSGFAISPLTVTPYTDWVITRPMKIEKAYTIWNDPMSQQAVDIPITLMTMEQYAALAVNVTGIS